MPNPNPLKKRTRRWSPAAAVLSIVLGALAMGAIGSSAAYAQEQASRDFSLVSVMHGKCIEAPSSEIAGPVSMHPCRGPYYPGQRWTYSAATGKLKTAQNRCVATAGIQITAPIKVEACDELNGNQKWDIDDRGRILLRGAWLHGERLSVAIANGDRSDGAGLWLTYRHRGENELFRRDQSGAGGSTINIESDLRSPDPDPACAAILVDYGVSPGIPAWLQDCQDIGGQRFERTDKMQLKLGLLCLDGGSGQAPSPVSIQVCDEDRPSQKWNLGGSGELTSINGLCLAAPGESNVNGNLLRLSSCNRFSPGQRWSFRDPR
jgi:hypothetical protein